MISTAFKLFVVALALVLSVSIASTEQGEGHKVAHRHKADSDYGTCTDNYGQAGVCQDTATCASPKVSTAGKCPGPANIQCCADAPSLDVECQDHWGTKGNCGDVAQCASPNVATPGLCPGPANIQCCTPPPPPLPEDGTCNLGSGTMMDAYRSGTKIGTVEVITFRGKPTAKRTACAFLKMERAYGQAIGINSAFRTMEKQTYFYNCYLNKNCNNGNLAAKPGYSNHQNGIALDLNVHGGVYAWLAANAHTHGFVRTVPSENWHWEYRPGSPKASYT